MNAVVWLIDFILHIDRHLQGVIARCGSWTYGVLFAIVFCETGLVITPLLPGDSLLFAAGAFAASGALEVGPLFATIAVAAILGDTVNYRIGQALGPKVFQRPDSRILKKEYLGRTQRFFARYGGKTIVLARFVPIVRTFAPFLAGVGAMSYGRFLLYNVAGGLLWTAVGVGCGWGFGNLPFVKKNFSLVVVAIVVVSLVPIALEWWNQRRRPGPPAP